MTHICVFGHDHIRVGLPYMAVYVLGLGCIYV